MVQVQRGSLERGAHFKELTVNSCKFIAHPSGVRYFPDWDVSGRRELLSSVSVLVLAIKRRKSLWMGEERKYLLDVHIVPR